MTLKINFTLAIVTLALTSCGSSISEKLFSENELQSIRENIYKYEVLNETRYLDSGYHLIKSKGIFNSKHNIDTNELEVIHPLLFKHEKFNELTELLNRTRNDYSKRNYLMGIVKSYKYFKSDKEEMATNEIEKLLEQYNPSKLDSISVFEYFYLKSHVLSKSDMLKELEKLNKSFSSSFINDYLRPTILEYYDTLPEYILNKGQ